MMKIRRSDVTIMHYHDSEYYTITNIISITSMVKIIIIINIINNHHDYHHYYLHPHNHRQNQYLHECFQVIHTQQLARIHLCRQLVVVVTDGGCLSQPCPRVGDNCFQ